MRVMSGRSALCEDELNSECGTKMSETPEKNFSPFQKSSKTARSPTTQSQTAQHAARQGANVGMEPSQQVAAKAPNVNKERNELSSEENNMRRARSLSEGVYSTTLQLMGEKLNFLVSMMRNQRHVNQ